MNEQDMQYIQKIQEESGKRFRPGAGEVIVALLMLFSIGLMIHGAIQEQIVTVLGGVFLSLLLAIFG